MTLTQCYQQNEGQAVLVPNGGVGNDGQCAQWTDLVYHEVYGLPYLYTPAAQNWWYDADELGITKSFTKLPAQAGMAIQVGDFVVYGPLSIADPQGHIDVCSRAGSLSDFWAYDSNWDAANFHNSAGFPTLHEVHHNDSFNKDILGILRYNPQGGDVSNDDATAILDSFFWNFLGRKIKASELEEYAPAFTGGTPDYFFKKAAQFTEVRAFIGGIDSAKLEQITAIVNAASEKA